MIPRSFLLENQCCILNCAAWRKWRLWRNSGEVSATSATCRFYILCAVSAVIAVFKTAKTAITALIFFCFTNNTIRITDSFSFNYKDLLDHLITLSPQSCGHFLFVRRDTAPLPKECLNTSIDTSKKNIKNSPRK